MAALKWWLLGGGVALIAFGGKEVVNLKDASDNEKKYAPIIADAEKKNGIPAGLLHRLIKQESHFRTEIITGELPSPVGALGIAQFMPATAKDEGVNPRDPVASIYAAAKYLVKQYKLTKSWEKAVASYNWGAGHVLLAVKQSPANWFAAVWPAGYKFAGKPMVPKETKDYVAKILMA
ncbi:MAG: transglycosylase SLT domain-containing protein [bacterium]|nr:transglycosylase SLT domain-containing protein [bacterium]